ncbi:MAG: SPOR domain-containing protein [Candidatus Cloacimonadota bacterium]|nr:SPOR domain-containing protein [Candidatus Cloacimonadota bacterium]
MMKRILIGLIISVLIVSSLSLIGCGKKEEKKIPAKTEKKVVEKKEPIEKTPVAKKQEKTPSQIAKKKTPIEHKQPKIVLEEKKYELQLVARKDYSRVEIEKRRLEKYGYNVKISNTKKNGETYYRLRLVGLYTPSQAKKVGDKIKKQFPSIEDYWIQKVK